MADQLLYDQNGAFQCVYRINTDGTQLSILPGSRDFLDYVAKNGTPPPTGAPTFPPPAPTADQTLIAAVKTMTPTQIQAQLPAIIQAMAKRLG